MKKYLLFFKQIMKLHMFFIVRKQFKIFYSILIIIAVNGVFVEELLCAPSNSMSISPSAVDGQVDNASDENSRNNEVSTKFNAHDHNDIDQTANTLAVGDATAGNKTIQANNADSNKPFIRYDDTDNIWIISENGTDVSGAVKRSGKSTTYRTLPESPAQGDILYASGSEWVSLAAGTSGQILQTQGPNANPRWYSPSTARAIRSAAQTLTTATTTKVQCDSETFDTNGEYDPTTNYRFTANETGKYLTIFTLDWEGMADGTTTNAYIYKNGSSVSTFQWVINSTTTQMIAFSDTHSLVATDYLEIFARHTAGVDKTLGTHTKATFIKVSN